MKLIFTTGYGVGVYQCPKCKTIKEEVSNKGKNNLTESIEQKINKTQESGSAINLIESKTYENPQFLRMKDLMTKIGVVHICLKNYKKNLNKKLLI